MKFLSWLVPLAVYVASARRDVWFWDTGEMDTVPWILGIAHPTGFPAYVVLGYAFSHVVAIGPVAFRMSLMSACAMAAAAYFVFRAVEDENANRWIAMGSAWFFAFGSIVWTRGTRAEVHALAACALAATIFYSLRWCRSGARRDLVAAAIAWGVGLAVHPVLLLALPALAFLALVRPGALAAGDVLRAAGAGAISALVWYVYLPLRSAYVSAHGLDPARALGLPPGPFWDYDHPSTLHGFFALVGGGDFDLAGIMRGIVAGSAHGAGLLQYPPQLLGEVMPFGIAAIAAGIYVAWIRNHVRAAALLLFALPCIVFGSGFPPESDPARYFIGSFVVAAIFIGDAMSFLARQLPRVRHAVTAGLVLAAALLVFENRWVFAQANDERARAAIVSVQTRTPQNAIVVANWLDAPPLAYAAYVEHSLGSRAIVAAWAGDIGERARAWRRTRPVFVAGPPNGDLAAVSPLSP